MAIDFVSPSYRAASSDLTIAISPLGLVELADEEFEVHGPRLNRYAHNWAYYLGHHWSHLREIGEPQLTFNYTRALSDFITNFTFGRGVSFTSPKETEAIVPSLLQRVWEVDNRKKQVIWEMGQQGSVSGDCFVKVAYEGPYVDPAGRPHPGRVRILPVNSSFAFPEWHPHDRTRLIRFKLKYRFWGCVDLETEALTRRGWLKHDQITTDDEILALDPVTDEVRWEKVEAVSVYNYKGPMHRWTGKVDALTTPNHRWLAEVNHGRAHTLRTERATVFSGMHPSQGRLVTGGGVPMAFATDQKWSNELVQTVAWYLTEGWDHVNQTGVRSVYLAQKRPEHVATIRQLAAWWRQEGATFSEYAPNKHGVISWYLGVGVREALWAAAPGKQITPEFLCSLTAAQARLFYETLMDGDGCRTRGQERWTQLDLGRVAGFQMLCAMLGKRTRHFQEKITAYVDRYTSIRELVANHEEIVDYDGQVWCPTVSTGYFMARRGGTTYWTGNTALEGTRQVFTYTELITEEAIEEYVNDELLDSRPNPLGTIPIVHISNVPISGSPWGLSDIHDITTINRQYNETMTDIVDIVNYHAAPVTVITGAKASQLERSPKKVWGGLPKDAQVFNLENGVDLTGPMAVLGSLKQTMHEMTGVPEGALGQQQPISNTSGVALAIQYQPLMNRYELKRTQYEAGFEKINELILLNLALYEPETFRYDPTRDVPLKDGQLAVLDPSDPVTYLSETVFPPPLPVDKLIVLNELQAKMMMGLESKRGAFRALGEEFPDEKMQELFDELVQDAKEQGALDMLRAQITQLVAAMTGIMVGPDGKPQQVESAGGSDVNSAGGGSGGSAAGRSDGSRGPLPGTTADMTNPASRELLNQLVSLAGGTKLPQVRNPENDD